MKSILFSLCCLCMLKSFAQKQYLLLGTYDSPSSEGIYVYEFNSNDGSAKVISHVKTSNPSFLSISPNKKVVFAVNEKSDKNGKGGSVSSFAFDRKLGTLTAINVQSSEGNHPCYITVDKKEVFNMSDVSSRIRWYQTEQEIKNDPYVQIPVTQEELNAVRKDTFGKIPEERLVLVAKNRKISDYAKEILTEQAVLSKSDFYSAANHFLSNSIEESLESKDILLNIFALVDRRVGKKRLLDLEEKMKMKHPIVQYFYGLRRGTL